MLGNSFREIIGNAGINYRIVFVGHHVEPILFHGCTDRAVEIAAVALGSLAMIL